MKGCAIAGITIAILAQTAVAASPAEQLAVDTYRHLVSYESLLDGAIRSGDKRDFDRFIQRPTVELMQRWPRLGDPAYDKFIACYFALDGFRLYSEDQFQARGQLPKAKAKDYFERKGQCRQALKGKV